MYPPAFSAFFPSTLPAAAEKLRCQEHSRPAPDRLDKELSRYLEGFKWKNATQ
jgi:hypothetical protein